MYVKLNSIFSSPQEPSSSHPQLATEKSDQSTQAFVQMFTDTDA
jgi:hypothetical protein